MNATKLKQLRKSKGLNRANFAALIGYSAESVKKWEQGNPISKRAKILLLTIK